MELELSNVFMKIAQIDINYKSSSTGKIVSDLALGLQERNYSTVVYFGRGCEASGSDVYKIASELEVALHALGTRVTGLTGIYSPLATHHLITLLKKHRPNVVHLHDLHGYFLNIGELVEFLKLSKIPTVWTFHSEFMYTGKCGHSYECEKWKKVCYACPRLGDYPKSWYFDFTTHMFEKKRKLFEGFDDLILTAPSHWLANRMRESPILNGKQIVVVPNGLDIKVFFPRDPRELRAKLGLGAQKVVLSVGSDLLSNSKGGYWVFELAKRNPTIIFLMVGVKKQSKLAPENVRQITSLHDQNLLAEYYSISDVFLLTSMKETFSMVCAESLACGTPIVGFEAGAPSEVAPQGFGNFVPYGDLELLNRSLINMLSSTAKMSKDSLRFKKFAHKRYSKDVMVDSFEDIYRQLTRDKELTDEN